MICLQLFLSGLNNLIGLNITAQISKIFASRGLKISLHKVKRPKTLGSTGWIPGKAH
jgi:hypothetical protein